MYGIRYLYRSDSLSLFIKEANKKSYKIIAMTQEGSTYTIVYENNNLSDKEE